MLTRGLVNKLLHPPMQALKQAAREGDSARLDALCEAWSVSVAATPEADSNVAAPAEAAGSAPPGKRAVEIVSESEAGVEIRR
jgi:glutamyl-tRNA reductase